MVDQAKFRDHLENDVLTWWLTHGPDPKFGGVHTCWSNDGAALISTDKYTWSQGRWVYLMAHLSAAAQAGQISGDPARYLELASSTAQFIADHQILPSGHTAYLTTTQGDLTTDADKAHQSIFADMFVALGWGALAEVTGDQSWGERATTMLIQARKVMRSGNYTSAPYPVPHGYGSLALPMITVNTAEQVFRGTRDVQVAELVVQAVDEVAAEYLQGDDIAEMPALAAGDPDSLLARHRTPGHILELLWFIWQARDLIPRHELADPQRLAQIALHALELGWDHEYGGLLRYVDVTGGKPRGTRLDHPYEDLVLDTWDTKLWWPHAEALYATALFYQLTGNAELGNWHDQLSRYCFEHFAQGPGQEWLQNLQRDGSPRAGVVALPVKDPFHVARSLLKLVQL